jgi:hypothetical protein
LLVSLTIPLNGSANVRHDIFDLLFEHFNDDLAQHGFTFIDGQPPMVLQETGELELGNGENIRLP